MKHLIEMRLTEQAGKEIEARPGGPGPVVGRIVERFKPEAVYMCPTRRAVIMVADLTEPDMAELMMVGSHLGGVYPTFTPVVSGKDFGELVGKAMPAAKKLLEG
jgi:hypothetical protein